MAHSEFCLADCQFLEQSEITLLKKIRARSLLAHNVMYSKENYNLEMLS